MVWLPQSPDFNTESVWDYIKRQNCAKFCKMLTPSYLPGTVKNMCASVPERTVAVLKVQRSNVKLESVIKEH